MKRWLGLLAPITLLAILPLSALAQFDHTHAAWTALLKKHAVVIADRPDGQAKVAEQKTGITFLDYDWGLNVATRTN